MLGAYEIKEALENVKILVDTREQPNDRFKKRVASFGCPWERCKLDFGDYSVAADLDGHRISLQNAVAVERKMNIDELCGCYCHSRARFEREFERAQQAGGKIIMLIENATWEKVYAGTYRSLMQPQALTASMLAWLARYNCQLVFCKPETSGKLIHDILYRELKERLERGDIE